MSGQIEIKPKISIYNFKPIKIPTKFKSNDNLKQSKIPIKFNSNDNLKQSKIPIKLKSNDNFKLSKIPIKLKSNNNYITSNETQVKSFLSKETDVKTQINVKNIFSKK